MSQNSFANTVADMDLYPGKMLIIKFQDGYRLVFTYKNNIPHRAGIEKVDLYDRRALVATYQTKRLDFQGRVAHRGRVEKLDGGLTQEMLAARWQAAEAYLNRILNPAAATITDEGYQDLKHGRALVLLDGASDYEWEHANRPEQAPRESDEQKYGHKLIEFNESGVAWWCAGCKQGGSNYTGDTPQDKLCDSK